jgi:hypothetical protein
MQDQVLANILAQPVGPYDVGSYGLPREFLAALADRITCASYQDTFRAFPGANPEPAFPLESGPPRRAGLIRPTITDASQALGSLPEERPPARGFHADGSVPFQIAAADPHVRAVSDLIARQLTRDGLIATTTAALHVIPLDRRSNSPAILRDAGLPVDLLDHFELDGVRGPHLLARLGAGGEPRALARAARFSYRPTIPGFRAMLEDGSERAGGLRLHLTGDGYWGGPGAGSSLEVASQFVRALPGLRVLAPAQGAHAEQLFRSSADWAGPEALLSIIVQDAPVSQWARDNAASGTGPGGGPAFLLPRYASRGEDGSILVPGDTLAGDALAAAGIPVRRSPLLFQGGNVMCVTGPRGGRLLLIGEAEVHRNTVLGLTAGEVVGAMRAEFGADDALILPGASFHIDFDVTIRRHDGQSIAFVNDTLAGASGVVRAALEVLGARAAIDPSLAASAQRSLAQGRIGEACRTLAPLYSLASAEPARLAAALSAGTRDPGAANLRVFLVGLDLLTVHSLGAQGAVDANHGGYLGALARLQRLRGSLRRSLERAGFRIVGVPSLSEQRVGLGYINCVHTPDALFIPAWGGLFSACDLQAQGVYRTCMSAGVSVLPLLCSETQRRAGGPHCAAGLIPAAADNPTVR